MLFRSADFKTITNTGQSILVIDLSAFGDPEDFKSRVDTLSRDIRASAKLPGVERIWLPGEQSHGKRQRYAEQGIPVPVAVKKDLDALSAQLHIAPLVVL